MKKTDDPLHPANVRSEALRLRNYRGRGVLYWAAFRKAGQSANAPIVLLRYAENAHDAAFTAGVKYAKKAIAKGVKP